MTQSGVDFDLHPTPSIRLSQFMRTACQKMLPLRHGKRVTTAGMIGLRSQRGPNARRPITPPVGALLPRDKRNDFQPVFRTNWPSRDRGQTWCGGLGVQWTGHGDTGVITSSWAVAPLGNYCTTLTVAPPVLWMVPGTPVYVLMEWKLWKDEGRGGAGWGSHHPPVQRRDRDS